MDKQAQSGTPFVERTDMPAPRNDRVLLVPSVAGAVGNLLEWYDFGLLRPVRADLRAIILSRSRPHRLLDRRL